MNDDLITLNEVLNDGSHIYLYPHEIGAWISYGYSAFQLLRIVQPQPFVNFSNWMQMPSVAISQSEFKHLVKVNAEIIEVKDGYYLLPTTDTIDLELYHKWVETLK